LRIFVSKFDQRDPNSFGEFHQDRFLRDILELTKFPPATKAFFTLLSQRTPIAEDSAVLSHCIYELCKRITPASMESDTLEQSRQLFDLLYQRLSWFRITGGEGRSDPLPYLHALDNASLLCPITDEPVLNGVLTTTGNLVERSLALEYQVFVLRKTTSATFTDSITTVGGGTYLERLCSFAGGRFRDIVFNHDISQTFVRSNPPLDLTLYKSRNYTGLFAIIAPADLKSVTAPALTLDSQGFVSVYTGIAPCTLPPAK
jgi:hypothetical protein